jgi:hypothetical protein
MFHGKKLKKLDLRRTRNMNMNHTIYPSHLFVGLIPMDCLLHITCCKIQMYKSRYIKLSKQRHVVSSTVRLICHQSSCAGGSHLQQTLSNKPEYNIPKVHLYLNCFIRSETKFVGLDITTSFTKL